MHDRIGEILRHFPTLLRRWDGALARMCEMTISHRTLTIRLERHGQVGNLEIACIGPTVIYGPTDWEDAMMTVEHGPDGFIVSDARAGVRIKTDHVEIAENRKPLNALTIPNSNTSRR
jgi:hypothetical protein